MQMGRSVALVARNFKLVHLSCSTAVTVADHEEDEQRDQSEHHEDNAHAAEHDQHNPSSCAKCRDFYTKEMTSTDINQCGD